MRERERCSGLDQRSAQHEAMSGSSMCSCRLYSTLSTKDFVAAGSTRPQTRLMIISTKPSASSQRRGRMSCHACGHASVSFGFAGELVSPSAVRVARGSGALRLTGNAAAVPHTLHRSAYARARRAAMKERTHSSTKIRQRMLVADCTSAAILCPTAMPSTASW